MIRPNARPEVTLCKLFNQMVDRNLMGSADQFIGFLHESPISVN
jgi:hypothetical protein